MASRETGGHIDCARIGRTGQGLIVLRSRFRTSQPPDGILGRQHLAAVQDYAGLAVNDKTAVRMIRAGGNQLGVAAFLGRNALNERRESVPDLSDEQKELLLLWNGLKLEEKEIVKTFMKSIKK